MHFSFSRWTYEWLHLNFCLEIRQVLLEIHVTAYILIAATYLVLLHFLLICYQQSFFFSIHLSIFYRMCNKKGYNYVMLSKISKRTGIWNVPHYLMTMMTVMMSGNDTTLIERQIYRFYLKVNFKLLKIEQFIETLYAYKLSLKCGNIIFLD